MNVVQKSKTTVGTVAGPFGKDSLVCQYIHKVTSKGIWFGDNVFSYTLPILLLQIIFIFFVSSLTYLFMKPLRQSTLVAHVAAGVIIGPTVLGRWKTYMTKLYPTEGKVMLNLAGNIGFMFHLFVLGVQMDTSLMKKASRSATLIGFACFTMPCALGALSVSLLGYLKPNSSDQDFGYLPFIAAINSITCFPVITSLLADLKLLNSELGRLAAFASLIADVCSFVMSTALTTLPVASMFESKWMSMCPILAIIFLMITIIFVLRPFILWLTKGTSEEQPLKENHFVVIMIIVLVCGLCTEFLGQRAAFGPFILGVALPGGPPIGSSLVHKIDSLNTGLLLPVFIAMSGLETDLTSAIGKNTLVTVFVIMVGYIAKFFGTLLPSIYFAGLPFLDAITLALIMCCKGIIEIATFIMWQNSKVLDDESFSILLITAVLITGIHRPLIQHLYEPSRRYTRYGTRSILNSDENEPLRILVCIHGEDTVPTIIKLLEAYNPTMSNPVWLFVLHLVELTGWGASILVPYHGVKKVPLSASWSERVVNAFNFFGYYHEGSVFLQHFIAVAPYDTMHNDICGLALDRRAALVIVPFHRKWAIDGTVGSTNSSLRTVNNFVLEKAPCSVGVLIDRGNIDANRPVLTVHSEYNVVLLFFGGADDREALAFGRNMVGQSNTSLTVIRFKQEKEGYETRETNIDDKFITDYSIDAVNKQRAHHYEEVKVVDGEETLQVIRSLAVHCDLAIVGRYHDPNTPGIAGLTTEWSECPELGVIGDMLASSDFRFSILLIQQQPASLANTHDSFVSPLSNINSADLRGPSL